MNRFGLKLFSDDMTYIDSAKSVYGKGLYHYIELYAVPDSFDFISRWQSLGIPFIIHAPHFKHGMNLSKKEFARTNMQLMDQTKHWADKLSAEIIIIHSGMDGDINESVRQLKQVVDGRCIVENKPYKGRDEGSFTIGHSVEQISFLTKNLGIGFCLDISHAIAAANSLKKDPLSYVKEFNALRPRMYHFADGVLTDIKDKHWHLGKGDYPLKEIAKIIPDGSTITIETKKDETPELIAFTEDLRFAEALFSKIEN